MFPSATESTSKAIDSDAVNTYGATEPVACPECDLLVQLPKVTEEKQLQCPRCQHTLSHSGTARLKRALPLGLCAAVLLQLSLSFPFMSFERSGVSNQMTLIQTSWALFLDGSYLLALLVMIFIIITPAVLVFCILAVSFTVYSGRFSRLSKWAARLLYTLTSWSMVEVFIIGVFVSLIKIASMATVELGVSLWTYLALSFTLVGATASLDKVSIWRMLSKLERKC